MTLSARFTPQEARLVRAAAERAGASVASVIRFAMLDQPLPPSTRRPTVDHETAGRMLAMLGQMRQDFRDAINGGQLDGNSPLVDAVLRDFAEMRFVWFEALGREP